MRRESTNFGRLAVQSLLVIGINILFAAIVAGIAYVMTNDISYVAQSVMDEANGSEDSLTYALSDAFALLLNWLVYAFATGTIFAIIFVITTESLGPQIEEDSRSRKPLWSFLLVALFVLAIAIWWMVVADAGIADLLLIDSYATVGLVGAISLFLAYFCATATCVKPTMQPSVPMADFMPSFGR